MNAELMRWALTAEAPSSRTVGSDRVSRVLIGLASYVGRGGLAYPGSQTLAEDLGIPERTVREAFDLLEAHGLIEAAEPRRRGRTTRWRLLDSGAENAGEYAGENAGQYAGEFAGGSAGIPAMKKRKSKNETKTFLTDRPSQDGVSEKRWQEYQLLQTTLLRAGYSIPEEHQLTAESTDGQVGRAVRVLRAHLAEYGLQEEHRATHARLTTETADEMLAGARAEAALDFWAAEPEMDASALDGIFPTMNGAA